MKAFVISLSLMKSSITPAREVLAQLTAYGFDAELFEGTYGDDAVLLFEKDGRRIADLGIKTSVILAGDFTELHPEIHLPREVASLNIRMDPRNDKTFEKMMRPGVIGCFYSHYRLWEHCIALDEPIFIFEDDVIFERGYHPVEWDDVLLLCTCKDHDFYRPLLYSPSGEPRAIPLPRTYMPGSAGYGITPKGARKLVSAYSKEFLPADNAMNVFTVKLQCHTHLMGRAATAEEGNVSLTKTYKRIRSRDL